jgi:hypothetical protein
MPSIQSADAVVEAVRAISAENAIVCNFMLNLLADLNNLRFVEDCPSLDETYIIIW